MFFVHYISCFNNCMQHVSTTMITRKLVWEFAAIAVHLTLRRSSPVQQHNFSNTAILVPADNVCYHVTCYNRYNAQELPKDDAAVQAKASRDIQLLTQDTAAAPDDQRWCVSVECLFVMQQALAYAAVYSQHTTQQQQQQQHLNAGQAVIRASCILQAVPKSSTFDH
jgi:hypothetical protein